MDGLVDARKACLKKVISIARRQESPEFDFDEFFTEKVVPAAGEEGSEVSSIRDEISQDAEAFDAVKELTSRLRERIISVAMEDTEPTDEEFSNLEAACQKLWKLDYNRLQPSIELEVNFQDDTYRGRDNAREHLFGYVDGQAMNKPTFTAFYKLLDNYVTKTGASESVTREE